MSDMFNRAGHKAAVPFNAPSHEGVPGNCRHLEVSLETAASVTRVCLSGTLETASAAFAYDTIVAAAAAPTRRLLLDLNSLRAATRAGCRSIHVAAKLLHGRGGRMIIFGAGPQVAEVMANTGFDNLIEFRNGVSPSAATASKFRLPEFRAASAWPSPERKVS